MAEALRDGRGGIAGLIHLIRKYGDVVEADFRRYHRVDLRDYLRPLRLRQFSVLVQALPPQSQMAVAVGGDGFSMLELLIMENGLAGPLNPRHPWSEAKQQVSTAKTVKGRQGYYDQLRREQSARPAAVAEQEPGREDSEEDAD